MKDGSKMKRQVHQNGSDSTLGVHAPPNYTSKWYAHRVVMWVALGMWNRW